MIRLAAFREAARQIRHASVIAQGGRVGLARRRISETESELVFKLLDEEPFRSLALSLRLVYQQREPAHFYTVYSLVRQRAPTALHERLDAIRAQYKDALANAAFRFAVVQDGKQVWMAPRVALETWMNAAAFHQDSDKQELFRALSHDPNAFKLTTQITALLLCGCVLQLDDTIADVTGEPQLPRILPSSATVGIDSTA